MLTRIHQNKLDLLQSAILQDNNEYLTELDAEKMAAFKDEVEDAAAVSDIWYVLFKYQQFQLYSLVKDNGIFPTTDELNEISQKYNAAPWYPLIFSKQGINEFKSLLKVGIQLDSRSLSACNNADNRDFWQACLETAADCTPNNTIVSNTILNDILKVVKLEPYYLKSHLFTLLMKNEIHISRRIAFLNILLENNIYPPAAYLQKIWNDLANYTNGIMMIHILATNAIFPTKEQLLNPFWSQLLKDDVVMGFEVLNVYLGQNILTKPEQLNDDFWTTLAEKIDSDKTDLDELVFPLIQNLVKKNILFPCKDKLNGQFWRVISDEDHFASDEYYKVFAFLLKEILKLGIFNASDLAKFNEIDKHNQSVWSNMICCFETSAEPEEVKERAELFLSLCLAGFLPSLQLLNYTINSDSIWNRLLDRRFQEMFTKIINILFKNDLFPNPRNENKTTLVLLHLNSDRIPRAKKIIELHEKYNLDFDNQLTRYLTRDNASDIYSFLYCYESFVLSSGMHPRVNKNLFTLLNNDILIAIGRYILPEAIIKDVDTFNNFIEENKTTFVKYHTITCLDHYAKTAPFLFNLFNHKQRAEGLQKAIKESPDPRALLKNHFFMSRGGIAQSKTPYPANSQEKYQQPFSNSLIDDEEFKTHLREGYLLSTK